MQFLADENVPVKSVKILRNNGFKVIYAAEESYGRKDVDVINYANNEKLIIITFDRDFGELHYKLGFKIKTGIIYLRFIPLHPEESAQLLLNLFIKNIDIFGQFTVVERDCLRQRPL